MMRIILILVASLVAAQENPSIDVQGGNLRINVGDKQKAMVDGLLHANELTIEGLDKDVKTELEECKENTNLLKEQLTDAIADATTNLSDTISEVDKKMEEKLKQLQYMHDQAAKLLNETTKRLENADSNLQKEIDDKISASDTIIRKHISSSIKEAADDILDQTNSSLGNVTDDFTASFDEVDKQLATAGIWEYTFSGSSSINKQFEYWLSIDHGGQGANRTDGNHKAGVSDSYHAGNWFLEVKASSGHCGGGCHISYFHQRYYFNYYCSKWTLYSNTRSVGSSESWRVDRIPDGHNGHANVCNVIRIRKNRGQYGFGGPYRIQIKSSKPLKALHTVPHGSCTFDTSGARSCGGCVYTVYASKNCKGHTVPPNECKRGRSAKDSLNLPSDPSDPHYDKDLKKKCCVNCNK